ncbi:MAG: glycosyltransferase family 2 protein [Acutalibacteraceae bacterium]
MNEQVFESVTIFVLASNETTLLEETVTNIRKYCTGNDLEKIVIVLKSRDCLSYAIAQKLSDECEDGKVELYFQKAKTLETCIAEIPSLVRSSHFIIMASDMEMSPTAIETFVEKAKKHPERIICASKWLKGSVVEGYGMFHEFGSRTMNTFVSLLIGSEVTDPFSIYQIYPNSVYEKMNFENTPHPEFEYTLRPLRCGVEYEEIPTVYKKRDQGKTNFNYTRLFLTAARFCYTAVRLRLTSPERLLADNKHSKQHSGNLNDSFGAYKE